MSSLLEIDSLNVYYGEFHALEDVNISIATKSVTAFIGPSGCGKSTLLRTLNRMHEITPGGRVEGRVSLGGTDLYASGTDPVSVRKHVGMVFQRPNPFPTMSIRENVLAGVRLTNRKISAADADDLVEKSLRGANLWNEVK
ncbi:MAG: ATP-binding cassette domain-containing protein, partial [Leucobacter sp.]|nr:ATP-binding cassette domain-containing protein [Leucobacter sp.]